MKALRSKWPSWVSTIALALWAGPVLAQAPAAPPPTSSGPMVYPSKGQTPQQLEKDKTECYGWARQQTGYDPAAAAQQQASPQGTGSSGGGAVGGAAKGAAAGAAIGAIAGDAGKGAAIGAGTGGVAGGARKSKKAAEQQQAAQQQKAAADQQLAQYQKAFGLCMEGRGYAVK